MANAPQNITLKVPRAMFAPPIFAPTAPRRPRESSDAIDTFIVSIDTGEIITISNGITAPTAKLAAEAIAAACTGRAELLSDHDVEMLRHLVNQGEGDNALSALTSDLAYLEAWGMAATGRSLPWPAPEALLLKFIAHHLWDPERRETDHGMPADVDENLRSQGFLISKGRTRQPRCAGGWPTGQR